MNKPNNDYKKKTCGRKKNPSEEEKAVTIWSQTI